MVPSLAFFYIQDDGWQSLEYALQLPSAFNYPFFEWQHWGTAYVEEFLEALSAVYYAVFFWAEQAGHDLCEPLDFNSDFKHF